MTDNGTLVAALRILARDIQSEDGIANAAIAEAADRIEALRIALADAINRPLGVEPDSATGLVTPDEMRAAILRRPLSQRGRD